MKRKIIRQGHNTLTITLPSKWIKRLDLKAGDEINVVEQNNGLFLTTQKTTHLNRADFDINALDIPTIWKYFMAVYREGYNEIMVRFDPHMKLDYPYKFLMHRRFDLRYSKKDASKRPVSEILQAFLSRFIGLEIVEHGKNFVLVREMGQVNSKDFDNSIRRVFLLVKQMAEETLIALKSNEYEMLDHIPDVDINLDKFHDYAVRILNNTNNKEPRKSNLIFSTLYLLEMIGDEFKNIANHIVQDFASSDLKSIVDAAENLKKQIDLYYDIYYKYDDKKIKEISKIDRDMYLNVLKFYKKATEEEKELMHHFRIISRYVNALLELRIEMEF